MKRKFVEDKYTGEVFLVFHMCEFYEDEYVRKVILERADGTFIKRAMCSVRPSDNLINPKPLRRGCIVELLNPNNEFYGKKLSVRKIEGEVVTLLTHKGEIYMSAEMLKIVH